MKRLAFLCAVAAFALACHDSPLPTDPARLKQGGSPPAHAAIQAQINAVINELFEQPEKQQAHEWMSSVKDLLSAGDTSEAAGVATELIDLGVTEVTQDNSEAALLNQLSGLLAAFVGVEGLGTLATDLETVLETIDPEDQDVGIGVIGSHGGLVTTNPEKGPELGFAGTRIPEEALEQSVVVLIERIRIVPVPESSAPASASASDLEQERCLPIGLPQFEGCYRFTTYPPLEEELSDSVEVGVCAEPVGLDPEQVARLRLHALDVTDGDSTVTALPLADVDFLDCSDFLVSGSVDGDEPDGLVNLARSSFRRLRQGLTAAFTPAPLLASNSLLGPASVGLGGKKGCYTDIGVALPAAIEKSDGDNQVGTVGVPLDTNPEVRVLDEVGAPVANAVVNFAVTAGGGSVSEAMVQTGPDGRADVSWTLGPTPGTNTLEAWSAGVSRDVVLEGLLITEPLVFTATGVAEAPLEVQVSSSRFTESRPDVYGNRIVWTRGEQSYRYTVVCEWDGTACTQVVDVRGKLTSKVVTHGSLVAWSDWIEIWACDWGGESCSTPVEVTQSSYYAMHPAVYGNVIVWDQDTPGFYHTPDIFVCEWNGGGCSVLKQMTGGWGTSSSVPDIHGDLIVWAEGGGYGGGGPTDLAVCRWTGIGCAPLVRVSGPAATSETNPAVYGNLIVWQDKRNGNWDIYLCEWDGIGCGPAIPITTHSGEQRNPAVYGDVILWEDSRNAAIPLTQNGNWDVYWCRWNGTSCSEPVPITTDESSQLNPAIHGNRVVWQDRRNGHWDIYLAEIN